MTDNSVQIKEFVNSDNFNLGLEKAGLSKWEGSSTMMDIPMVNGVYQINIPDPEAKKKILAWLGIDDFNSDKGKEVLANHSITVNSGVNSLNLDDPSDLFNYYLIKSKFGIVAPTYDDAMNPMSNYKFYIANDAEEQKTKVTKKERMLEASAELLMLKKKEPKRLIYLAKFILPNHYSVGTLEQAFLNMTEYVEGKIIPLTEKPFEKFLDATEIPNEELMIRVDIKDAVRYGIIRRNKKGVFFNHLTGNEIGRTEDEMFFYLSQPQNQDELGTGTSADAPISIRYQLNNRK